ncbi:MAG: hypothetical protein RL758_1098 [Pseudomonadota bacterium]|jgi:D-lactate dehydrogenase (cytochrome)
MPCTTELIAALQLRFGAQFSTGQSVREQHGRDESAYSVPPPDGVVFAESVQDVADAVRLCAQHKTPIIPFGVGSSLEGQVLAVRGGISLDLMRMNQVLHCHAEDLTVTVQAGVTRKQLNDAIKSEGLFFPIDPGADASIGGMCATRASGTNAVRYGTMRENVLGLTVVTAQGEIIRTGTRAKKSSAGYDITRLMIGSEGTLGVITEITLKVYPLPEAVSAAICSFPSIEAAVRTAMTIIQLGVPIARCELLDGPTVAKVNAYSKTLLREEPLLLMEFHGSPASVQEQAEVVQELAQEHGGQAFEWATTPEARTRLWTARHHTLFAALASRPGCKAVNTDACVPISRLAECLLEAAEDVHASGIPHFLVGHVGDGNFHFGYLIDPENETERQTADALSDRLARRAIAMGGTCSGEHGVGLHKMGYLVEEAGAGSVALMRAIKQALDPLEILNPGKMFAGS